MVKTLMEDSGAVPADELKTLMWCVVADWLRALDSSSAVSDQQSVGFVVVVSLSKLLYHNCIFGWDTKP